MKQRGFRHCPTCSTKLQKRGLTVAGTQRWYCPSCASSATRTRADLSRGFTLERFVVWLMGKQAQTELKLPNGVTDRTWRTQTAWCWQVAPKPPVTGEVYPIILLDGIRIGSLVCLIARTPQYAIAWHWAGWESSHTWEKLLERLPTPAVVICDGQKGILLAIARCWPTAHIQRCIFHVWQNTRTKLTLHPQTEAGQELLQLARTLLKGLTTAAVANQWQAELTAWHQRHGSFIRERTYATDPRPGKRKWRYTHERVRSAYRQLVKLLRDDQLFTYLDKRLLQQSGQPIPRTTNHVEGGINSQLRTKLKLHRGMSEEHQRRLVEWYLYGRTEDPKPPRNFL